MRGSPSTTSVPNLSSTLNLRRNSNSSSNEADEESSLSSLNSNHVLPINQMSVEENSTAVYMTSSVCVNTTNMSTFKSTNLNSSPSKPSDIKKRSNNRKQSCSTLNSNNNNNIIPIAIENEICPVPVSLSSPPPPPPPPFPGNFDKSVKTDNETSSKCETVKSTSDFQLEIERAKNRLKKVDPDTLSEKTIVKSLNHRKFK